MNSLPALVRLSSLSAGSIPKPMRLSRSNYLSKIKALEVEWDRLCDQYLPILPGDDGFWRMSQLARATGLTQGFKLHVSASILNACDILVAMGDVLQRESIVFKAPKTLQEVQKLNAGIHYGYSQIGKIFTLYPDSNEQALYLAALVHAKTQAYSAPTVPYDLPYAEAGIVYYRYGAFDGTEITQADGTRIGAIRQPDGDLVPDRRVSGAAIPDWVGNPFPNRLQTDKKRQSSRLTNYRAYRALAQRGRGGVYDALDFSTIPMRQCILKEGRKDGEVDFDGRDGFWRVKNEKRVLSVLSERNIRVPSVIDSFQVGANYYLVTEKIQGVSLQDKLIKRKRRLPTQQQVCLAVQLAALVCELHSAGWAWRDCKPGNLILDLQGNLYAIDFEGACRLGAVEAADWGTPEYLSPERELTQATNLHENEDLYAMGVTFREIIAGMTSSAGAHTKTPLKRCRTDQLKELYDMTEALLSSDPDARPRAWQVCAVLKTLAESLSPSSTATRCC